MIIKIISSLSLAVIAASLAFLAFDRYEEKQEKENQIKHHDAIKNTEADTQKANSFILPSHTGGYLRNPVPPFPTELIEKGITNGRARVEVMVEKNGLPSEVKIINATHPLFAESAEKTIKQHFVFRPAIKNGEPIRSKYTFTIRFRANR